MFCPATILRWVCLTPWDVQSRRIFEETGTWPALYSGEGGGHGYIQTEERTSTAFACNQRDEVRDLHDVAGALGALRTTRKMQMQTFVAQEPLLCRNNQGGNRMNVTGEVSSTLRAQEHGHQPLVMATQQGGALFHIAPLNKMPNFDKMYHK